MSNNNKGKKIGSNPSGLGFWFINRCGYVPMDLVASNSVYSISNAGGIPSSMKGLNSMQFKLISTWNPQI